MTDSTPDPDSPPKPRGLWSLMSKAASESSSEPNTSEHDPAVEPDTTGPTALPPRSLFDVMRQARSTDLTLPASADEIASETADPSTDLIESQEADEERSGDEALELPSFTDLREPIRSVKTKRTARRPYLGLACGFVSVPLSALAIRPEVWMNLPASLLGFSAIILGYLSLPGNQQRENSSSVRLIASSSVALGIVGVFLGPLYFSKVGRDLRELKTDPSALNRMSIPEPSEK